MSSYGLQVSELVGKTLVSVERIIGTDGYSGDEIIFVTDNGEKYRLYHSQDCCETVEIEDICGELSDLVGSPICQAEESTNETGNKKGSMTSRSLGRSIGLQLIRGPLSSVGTGRQMGITAKKLTLN